MKPQSPVFRPPFMMLRYLMIGGLLLVLAGGCGASSNKEAEQLPVTATGTVSEAVVTPTKAAAPTRTPLPSQPLENGNGLADSLPLLSVENAAKLQVLGSWGNGIAYDMAYAPDGESIAISTSRALLLLDAVKMVLLQRVETAYPIYRIAFTDDGHYLYGGGAQGKLYQYDLAANTLTELPLQETYPITALAAAHLQPWILTATWDRTVNLVDLQSQVTRRTLTHTLAGSQALAFGSVDDKFFTWSTIEPIKRWDLAQIEMEQEIYFGLDANQRTGSQVRFSADVLIAAANQEWQVRVQNLTNGTTLGVLKGFNLAVKDLDISSDGAFVLTLHADQIRYWQSAKSKQLSQFSLTENREPPQMLRLARDGQHFITLGSSLSFYSIDAETNEITLSGSLPLYLSPELAYPAQFSDETTLAFPLLDGSLNQLDLAEGKFTFLPYSGSKVVAATAVGEGNLQALAFGDATVQVIDLFGETQYAAIRGLSTSGAALAVSAAGDILAVQTGPQTSGLWRISTGDYLTKLEWDTPAAVMQFSVDGKTLIVSGAGKTQLYNLVQETMGAVIEGRFLCAADDTMLLETYAAEGTQLQWMTMSGAEVLQRISAEAMQAAVNPQGTILAISSPQLKILDLSSGEALLEMENPAPGAQLRFTPDGKVLLLIRADNSVLVMGLPLND
jgi:WD40 repeat protein